MSTVSIRHVRKAYAKNEVVHGVDLEIASGEFVVILGPSGCGKSTLLRMIAGLESITSGEITIGGAVVNKLEPRERGCAMVFQNYALYPHMSVAENIGYALKIAGVSKAERMAKIKSVAETLNIADFLDRKPSQLSGGQRQRVAMGRAMIREPNVFLYDEPLSNLDAKLRVAMRVEIRKLQQRLGTTTLFVTHDQVEAMTLADRIVVMNKGTIEQVGTPWEIYTYPATTYVANFIGAPGLNLMKGVVDADKSVVRLVDGTTLPYEISRWPKLVSGDMIVGFRAEAVEFTTPERGLKFTTQFTEELGATRLVHGSLAGEFVIATINSWLRTSIQPEYNIAVAPSSLQFFEVANGRRVENEMRQADPVAIPSQGNNDRVPKQS